MDKPTINIIVDVPGWSLDCFARRVQPHFSLLRANIHYLLRSMDDIRANRPYNWDMPEADCNYFASWWFYYMALRDCPEKTGEVVSAVDVVDCYSWRQNPAFGSVQSMADVIFTQAHDYWLTMPCSVFHPFPVDADYIKRQRKNEPYDPKRALRLGIIGNGSVHTGNDFKGIQFIRELVATSLPSVHLSIAGMDVSTPYTKGEQQISGRIIPSKDMPEWYDSLDGFLILSPSEGFSAACVDALSLGCPVIGTPVSPLEPFLSASLAGAYIPVQRDRLSVINGIEKLRRVLMRKDRLQESRAFTARWSAKQTASIIENYIYSAIRKRKNHG